MIQQPPLRYLPPFLKILTLFALMLICMQMMFFSAAYIIHQYLGVVDTEAFSSDIGLQAAHPMAALLMQFIGTGLGVFLLPSLMFSALTYGAIGKPLKLVYFPNAKQFLITIGLILCSGIFIALLVDINKLIPLPESLSSLKDFQQKYDTLLNAFFKDVTPLRFAFITLVLAVMPAIGEELFFRGSVLKILSETRLGIHGAVVFSALAFSLMHFEFYNTFAIFFMGLVLGYIYYFTQSIWASIAAHFVNNFLQVLLKYLFATGVLATDITTSEHLPLYLTITVGVFTFALLWLLCKNKSAPIEEKLPNLDSTNTTTTA
ncbi:MAG TPA: type II CAAX endopeptidase family protein [Chitinophagales bacterium]|nr:type II CAAX endopeptidase family protein [Chitinophagales bacterium]